MSLRRLAVTLLLLAPLIAMNWLPGGGSPAHAQVFSPQINPSYVTSASACPSYSGATLGSFPKGMLCFRYDTTPGTFWTSNGDGTWSQVLLGGAAGANNGAVTGPFSITGTLSASGVATLGGIVAGASGSTPQVLSAGDVVLAKVPTSVAPAGPGQGFGVLRLRPSPTTPGSCRIVAVVGTGFNLEFAVMFQNPVTGQATVVDLPGGC